MQLCWGCGQYIYVWYHGAILGLHKVLVVSKAFVDHSSKSMNILIAIAVVHVATEQNFQGEVHTWVMVSEMPSSPPQINPVVVLTLIATVPTVSLENENTSPYTPSPSLRMSHCLQ